MGVECSEIYYTNLNKKIKYYYSQFTRIVDEWSDQEVDPLVFKYLKHFLEGLKKKL